VWEYPTTRRPGVLAKLDSAARAGKRVEILRSDAEVARFLERLTARGS
jgi:hypothetical protein